MNNLLFNRSFARVKFSVVYLTSLLLLCHQIGLCTDKDIPLLARGILFPDIKFLMLHGFACI